MTTSTKRLFLTIPRLDVAPSEHAFELHAIVKIRPTLVRHKFTAKMPKSRGSRMWKDESFPRSDTTAVHATDPKRMTCAAAWRQLAKWAAIRTDVRYCHRCMCVRHSASARRIYDILLDALSGQSVYRPRLCVFATIGAAPPPPSKRGCMAIDNNTGHSFEQDFWTVRDWLCVRTESILLL